MCQQIKKAIPCATSNIRKSDRVNRCQTFGSNVSGFSGSEKIGSMMIFYPEFGFIG
jgi:hypothetical protein